MSGKEVQGILALQRSGENAAAIWVFGKREARAHTHTRQSVSAPSPALRHAQRKATTLLLELWPVYGSTVIMPNKPLA
jgi:hypothetical protein